MLLKGHTSKERLVDIFLWEKEQDRDTFKSIIPSNEIHLNLGCGEQTRSGFLNCGIERIEGLDILMNLDYSLPFKDNSYPLQIKW